MKIVHMFIFLLLPFFLACPALAQTTAPAPLVLPMTDRIVIGTCYLKIISKTQVQRLEKDGFSEFVQEETDKTISEFSKKMIEAGFKEVVPLNKCSIDDDTAGGGVTVQFVFAMVSQFIGNDVIGINAFVKVPHEKRVVKIAAKVTESGQKQIIGIENVIASLSKEMVTRIREAQSRGTKTPPEVTTKIE